VPAPVSGPLSQIVQDLTVRGARYRMLRLEQTIDGIPSSLLAPSARGADIHFRIAALASYVDWHRTSIGAVRHLKVRAEKAVGTMSVYSRHSKK